ncbi:MAG TPA: murein transglycosylase A [Alphaproteobacteria bacterium]|nr:murein transglycosylase A [Alphaproteobacteria bacterium]
MTRSTLRRLCALALALTLSACAGTRGPVDESAPLTLAPASFSELPGWVADDHAAALEALRRSCGRILKKRDASAPVGPVGGRIEDWQPLCRAAAGPVPDARPFFERWFTPYAASANGVREGLFTGYYESTLRGSRVRTPVYRYPLHRRPGDLVTVDLGEFRPALKGQRIAGRVVQGALKPYETRAQIVSGNWPHRADSDALVWLDDPVDAFFVQIQGSGRVALADGGTMQIGYAGQNGHPYYAVGRDLVQRGILGKEEVSMDSIRKWVLDNPDQAADFLNKNPSYVFFREMPETAGPEGAEGVTLTPGRSLAVDRTKIPYGAPVWLDADPPKAGERPIRRLMVAQDTGGAIRGAVRGDVFWGRGERAQALAGPMKSRGRMWILLPNGAKGKN